MDYRHECAELRKAEETFRRWIYLSRFGMGSHISGVIVDGREERPEWWLEFMAHDRRTGAEARAEFPVRFCPFCGEALPEQ